jgi:hypothetical protein
MQLLCCPHHRRRPGGLAAHPFMGVNARLLVLGLFGVFPVQLAPIWACAPSSSDSSELISLIALALAPAQMAVWPAFAADGARPLVSAFLANLWACSTPSGAGSTLSSKTLPALFFCRLSRFRVALFHFWGVTTPESPMPAPASACNTPQHLLRRGRRPPLGLQCPIAEATTNSKESCASTQY